MLALVTIPWIGVWADQSGLGRSASQLIASQQPIRVQNAVNGHPVVRFSANSSQLLTLPNFMSGATEGEMFIVLKAEVELPTNYPSPWRLGTPGSGASYPFVDGHLIDEFGTNTAKDAGDPTTPFAQYNLYNPSSKAGDWKARFNGVVFYQTNSNVVAFRPDPVLGRGLATWGGDIAEIIIYDRVLTAQERETVSNYLNRKYALAADENYGNYRDTNGDGLSDNEDRILGIDPYNLDVDGDGVPNFTELQNGTDPLLADTDGDGVGDGSDAYPLDPNRSQALVATPGDTTPPVITLTKPADAILLP